MGAGDCFAALAVTKAFEWAAEAAAPVWLLTERVLLVSMAGQLQHAWVAAQVGRVAPSGLRGWELCP